MSDIQKEFRDYALSQGWCIDGESTQNGYLFYNPKTNDRWIGWQAAKSQVIPEDFVLAPKEPTKEMYLAGTQALLEIDLSDVFDMDSIQVYKAMLAAIKQKGTNNEP